MNKDSKILVAGHTGLVGSAVKRRLEKGGYGNLVLRSYPGIDMTCQQDVEGLFS